MVGKVPIKEKEDAICIWHFAKVLLLHKLDTNSLMHLLTYYYYAPSYNYTPFTFKANKGCVTLWPFPFTLKVGGNRRICIQFFKYLKAKEELWKLKYFTMQKCINLQKNPLKETKILQDIITLL